MQSERYPALTYDEAKECLSFISPELDYKNWTLVGRSLYIGFGDDGFKLFDDWSSSGSTYNKKTIQSQWKSYRNTTGVTLGSLIYLAKENGWIPNPLHDASKDIDREKLHRERIRREEEAKARQKAESKAREKTLAKSEAQFNKMKPLTVASTYLKRKKIEVALDLIELKQGQDFFGKYTAWALYDSDNKFCGFERIYDTIDSAGKTKKLLAKKSKSSKGFGCLGDLSKAKHVFVVGGLADGIAAHISTNECVVFVVGEGNIPGIITQLQSKYPEKEFISAPDHDKAGLYVAKQSKTRWTVPQLEGDDWNDVYCKKGAEELKKQLNKINGFKKNYVQQEKLNIKIIENTCNLIKSAKGTGKSFSTGKWVRSRPDLKTLIISYRVPLLASLAADFKAQFYQDLIAPGSNNEFLRSTQRLVITPDSLWRLAGSKWDVVFIDEFEQTAQHYIISEMRRKTFNLDCLEDILRSSKTQILADADLSEQTEDFLEKIGITAGVANINTHKPRTDSTMYVYDSASHLEQQAITWLSKGESLFISSNSKNKVNNLAGQLKKMGWSFNKQFIDISSKNSQDKDVLQLIQNINERAPELQAILGSPSIGTGVSIDKHNFTKTIGIFRGHIGTAEQAHQQLARARGVTEYHVFLDPARHQLPTEPSIIERLLLDEPDLETCEFLGIENGQVCVKHKLFEWLYCKVKAFMNLNKNQFKQRFLEQAEAEGYKVVFVNKNELMAEIGKNCADAVRKTIHEELKVEIAEQPLLTEEQLKNALYDESEYKDSAIIKAQIFKSLNLEDYDKEDRSELLNELTFDEMIKRRVSKLKKLSVASLTTDVTKKLDIRNRKFATSRVDLKHYSKKKQHLVKILAAAGIDEKLNYNGKTWTNKETKALRSWLLRNRESLYKYSGIAVSFQSLKTPVRWFNDFIRGLGLTVNSEQKRSGKDRLWLYSIDEEQLKLVRELVSLRNKGIEAYLTSDKPEVYGEREQQQKSVTERTTVLYTNNTSNVTNDNDTKVSNNKACKVVNLFEDETKNHDTLTADDLVVMAAESVGVSIEFAYQNLSSDDIRDISLGNLTFELLETYLQMKQEEHKDEQLYFFACC
ncbi:plasmid replication protein, CyRepA1 family [Zooshikella sp. RANM57]|uniref:plasmid replication protein, CyRepA1 family n=1 Tax=Zooshikella sp. RANM57 TaxID=3425863 RepID=UPI003D6F1BD6